MLVYHSQLLVHIEFGTGTLTSQPKGDQFFWYMSVILCVVIFASSCISSLVPARWPVKQRVSSFSGTWVWGQCITRGLADFWQNVLTSVIHRLFSQQQHTETCEPGMKLNYNNTVVAFSSRHGDDGLSEDHDYSVVEVSCCHLNTHSKDLFWWSWSFACMGVGIFSQW